MLYSKFSTKILDEFEWKFSLGKQNLKTTKSFFTLKHENSFMNDVLTKFSLNFTESLKIFGLQNLFKFSDYRSNNLRDNLKIIKKRNFLSKPYTNPVFTSPTVPAKLIKTPPSIAYPHLDKGDRLPSPVPHNLPNKCVPFTHTKHHHRIIIPKTQFLFQFSTQFTIFPSKKRRILQSNYTS